MRSGGGGKAISAAQSISAVAAMFEPAGLGTHAGAIACLAEARRMSVELAPTYSQLLCSIVYNYQRGSIASEAESTLIR